LKIGALPAERICRHNVCGGIFVSQWGIGLYLLQRGHHSIRRLSVFPKVKMGRTVPRPSLSTLHFSFATIFRVRRKTSRAFPRGRMLMACYPLLRRSR
jgi:hypothetical protein